MIDSYQVEVERGKKWVKAPEMDIRFGQLFSTPMDLKKAFPLDCTDNGFDFVIVNKNISPNETVQGWMLFGFPIAGKLRLHVKEASGIESATEFITANGSGETNLNMLIQRPTLKVLPGGPKDISNIRPILSEN